MPMPAATATAAAITKKMPRGVLIRAQQELRAAQERAEETGQHPIPLPLFFFLLTLAMMLDALTLIPIVGTIANFVIGPAIWITYYFVGVKGLAIVTRFAIIFLITSGFLVELIPGLQKLPINTTLAVVVYFLMSPQIASISERVRAVLGKSTQFRQTEEMTQKARPVIGKASETV